jgi:hypothetical protein
MIFAAAAVVSWVFLFVALSVDPPPSNPGVAVEFLYRTNSPMGSWFYFSVTNSSPLKVHLLSEQAPGGVLLQRHVQTIPPRDSLVVPLSPSNHLVVLRHEYGKTNGTVPADFGFSNIVLGFRRQDTIFEEGREMLDSVLQSVGIAVPGLNPDSARNQFQVTAGLR